MEIIEQARRLLEHNKRISLRALKREYSLDDEALEDVVNELVSVQRVASLDASVLNWIEHGARENRRSSDTPTASTPAIPAVVQPSAAIPHSILEGERRQLTVLFCDLADSTRLSSQLDPEDWREVVQLYQAAAVQVMERFEGHVAQYLGDGILVYFGHPVGHEDDAERAVRTGLGIVGQMEALNASLPRDIGPIQLRVRIGVHTGPVVMSAVGDDVEQLVALGDTTNIATSLHDHASPDSIVMSRQTSRLVQGVFVTRGRGKADLEGIPDPVEIIEVERVSGVRSRLDVLAATDLTPLVGREQELGLFEDRFGQVCEDLGQAILVNGEAGIGKSRLIQAFRERMQDVPHSWLECRCSPYTQDSSLHPILDLIRQALGFRPDSPPDFQIESLEAGLEGSDFDLAETLPLLADMHGLPLPEGYEPLNLAPEGVRKKSLALMVEWVLRLAQSQPLVLLVEDLHWVDPTTLELFGGLLDQIPRTRVLLLLTHRPDFEPPWPPKSHVTPMQLSRMTRAQLTDLVRKSVRDRVLPEEWLEQIIRRSDGVPLFAEELTRTVIETNPDVPVGGEVPTLHIPETLQDSLMARLDALGPVKELAQLGSVLGREFDYELLLHVSPLREDSLQAALKIAIQEELFYQRGTPPDATYLFKHALIRDAAYQSLLRTQRQRYHLRVADTMIERSPTIVGQQPERVAQHLTDAGETARAVPMWQVAGRLAAERSAHAEAEAHLRRAVALLPDLEDDNASFELDLYDALVGSALTIHGFGSDEVGELVNQLSSLAESSTDDYAASLAFGRACAYHSSRGDQDLGLKLANRQYEGGMRLGSDRLINDAISSKTACLIFTGRFEELLEAHQQLHPVDDALHLQDAIEVGTSSPLSVGIWASWATWHLGRPTDAIALAEETFESARRLQHPHTSAFVLTLGAMLFRFVRDYKRCLELATDAHRVSVENGFALWEGLASLTAAHASTMLDDPQVGAVMNAIRESADTGNRAGTSVILSAAAETQRTVGDIDAALGLIEFGFSESTPYDMLGWHSELHRLRGEILAIERRDPRAAEANFLEGLEFARNQKGKSNELRLAVSYGRLLKEQGRSKEAHALLAAIYEQFDQGHDLPDLVDAERLLGELGD